MKGKHYKTLFTLAILMLLMVPQGACALQNRFFKMNFPDLVQTELKDKTFNF